MEESNLNSDFQIIMHSRNIGILTTDFQYLNDAEEENQLQNNARKRKRSSQVSGTPTKRARKDKLQTRRRIKQQTGSKKEKTYTDVKEVNTTGRFGDCSICMDELGTKPMASTKCGHVFCEECLKLAMRKKRICPTCRCVLRGKSAYHPLYL